MRVCAMPFLGIRANFFQAMPFHGIRLPARAYVQRRRAALRAYITHNQIQKKLIAFNSQTNLKVKRYKRYSKPLSQ